MKAKRTVSIALILTALMASVSCGSDQPQNDVTSPASDLSSVASDETTAPDPYAGIDLEGFTLRILNVKGVYWNIPMLDHDEMTGDNVSDAVYKRNRDIEDRLNFKIEITQSDDTTADLVKTVSAAADEYDAVYTLSDKMQSNITNGYFKNILDIPEIDVTSDWWDPKLNDDLTVSGKYLYQASSAFNPGGFIRSVAVAFNKNILGKNNLDAPYELVRSGKWDYDAMREYAAACANLNGDDSFKSGTNAVFGTTTHSGWVNVVSTGAEGLVQKNDKGELYYAGVSEKLTDALDKMASVFSGDGMILNDYECVEYFMEDRALFVVTAIGNIGSMRDMNSEYGMIPVPKFDDASDYTAPMGSAFLLGIPVTNTHLSETAKALDALSRAGYETVLDTFFESLCYKGLRDDDSIEMMEIINSARSADLGYTFGWTVDVMNGIADKLMKGKTDIASSAASAGSKIEEKIKTFMETIAK